MKIGVCEMIPEMIPGSAQWMDFATNVRAAALDLLLLNEMPFGPWISAGERPDPEVMLRSRRLHEEGLAVLGELGVPVVLGTRPAAQDGRDVNEAFVWTENQGVEGVHTKQYFPDEPGFYEARWFQAGERHFRVAHAGQLRTGFLICTEVMFNEHARRYGRQGAQVIAVPRAAGRSTLDRWLVAMRMAAMVSGCYVLSSNRGGTDSGGLHFGGSGWIIDPEGDLVARTSAATPVACYDFRPEFVAAAQRQYPCYVPEL